MMFLIVCNLDIIFKFEKNYYYNGLHCVKIYTCTCTKISEYIVACN